MLRRQRRDDRSTRLKSHCCDWQFHVAVKRIFSTTELSLGLFARLFFKVIEIGTGFITPHGRRMESIISVSQLTSRPQPLGTVPNNYLVGITSDGVCRYLAVHNSYLQIRVISYQFDVK